MKRLAIQWFVLMLITTPLVIFFVVWPEPLDTAHLGRQAITWVPTLLLLALATLFAQAVFYLLRGLTGDHTVVRAILLALVVLGMSAAVGGFIVVPDALNAMNNVRSSVADLEQMASDLNQPETLGLEDFDRLHGGMSNLVNSLGHARRYTRFLGPFASLNDELALGLGGVNAVYEFSRGTESMMVGIRPLLAVSGSETAAAVMEDLSAETIVEVLEDNHDHFVQADTYLTAARAEVDKLDLATVPNDWWLRVEAVLKLHSQLYDMNRLLLDAPELLTKGLGLSEDAHYIVFSQNSDEIRPSGGFNSTYGEVTVAGGELAEYAYYPTSPTSPVTPPTALASELDIPAWWPAYEPRVYTAWAGSWYADFPTTAELAAWYYDNGDNALSSVDGVIAVDIVGFELMLEALGDITLEDYDRTVTAENFRDIVYEIRSEGQYELEHKKFLAAMYSQILDTWKTGVEDPEISTKLFNGFLKAVQEKHIMLYFRDEALNQAVNLLGWSGAQTPGTGHDYLMVADANRKNKSGRSVHRHVDYAVTIQADGSLASETTLTYSFLAEVAELDPAVGPEHGTRDYNNLFQVFVPADSTLGEVTGLPVQLNTEADDTHTIFAAAVVIAYDSTETYTFTYTSPPVIEPYGPYQRYRLLLQKQAGRLGDTATVHVTLPDGAEVIETSPRSQSADDGTLTFDVVLTTDQWIEVVYQ